MNKIEIPLSKTKISLLSFGALVFVTLGIIFLITPETFNPPIINNPLIIRIVGLITVLFFGFAGLHVLKKLFSKTIGLTIDDNGITDNTSSISVGLIDWADITEIKTKQVMSTKFLLIYINNPDKYLNRVNGFNRNLLKGNMKMYGAPISITSDTLKYKYKDLESLIKNRLIERKEKMPNH